MEKIKITAIVGSLRQGSLNHQLALEAGKTLKAVAAEQDLRTVDFEILDYSDIPLFNQDNEHPAPDAVNRIREIVKSSDGIWLFSPEYNHFFPGILKNLID